jgi:hypothetical protein
MVDDLDRMLERWTGAGLITLEQARAIRSFEKRDPASRTVPSLAEVIAYAGAVCVLGAVAVIASRMWPSLTEMAQLALLTVATGLLWGGGWWARSDPNPVLQRLATFLWFLSAGGVGWVADVVATDLWDLENGYALLIGLSTSLYAGLLYLFRRTSLQQIALFCGVGFLCAGASDVAGGNDWFGLLLWVAGAVWIALTCVGILTPRRTAFVLGALGVLGGAEAVVIDFFETPEGWGLALGLISSAALLYLSVTLGQMVLLGFGTGGLFLFLVQLIGEYLAAGLGGPLTLLVAGVALLGIALVTVRLKDRVATG